MHHLLPTPHCPHLWLLPIGSLNPRQNNPAAVPRFTGKGADTKSVKAYYFLVSILGVPLASGYFG